MNYPYPYFLFTQESLGSWAKELFARVEESFAPGRERRFVWPEFGTVPVFHHTSNGAPLLRIGRAMAKASVLQNQAVAQYTRDFNDLAANTLRVIAKNTMEEVPEIPSPDASTSSTLAGIAKISTNMWVGAFSKSLAYGSEKSVELYEAMLSGDLEQIAQFWERQVNALDIVVNQNMAAREKIKAVAGFHFEHAHEYTQVAETSRAILYQVLPLTGDIPVRASGKPVLHVAPFILRKDIIALLPHGGMSYVHAFAESGTPTYVLHIKDILETPEVQTMTGEDFITDIKFFAETLQTKHGLPVTLNGTCQGAYLCLLGCLSGKFDACVDALIQNVPPNDLTRSKRFEENMRMGPRSQMNLDAISVTLQNGNRVVSGYPASLSMRLSNFGEENPVSQLVRDMRTAERGITDMGSALGRWLQDITPMPYEITKISQHGSMTPITRSGVMPVRLFGKELHLRHLVKSGIKLHVVAGEMDDAVEPAAALAPFSVPCVKAYAGATFHVIPHAGHVAPLTTCAVKGSKNYVGNKDGSLWFHLQLETEAMNRGKT